MYSIHINRAESIHLDLCDVTELSPISGKLLCDDILVNWVFATTMETRILWFTASNFTNMKSNSELGGTPETWLGFFTPVYEMSLVRADNFQGISTCLSAKNGKLILFLIRSRYPDIANETQSTELERFHGKREMDTRSDNLNLYISSKYWVI